MHDCLYINLSPSIKENIFQIGTYLNPFQEREYFMAVNLTPQTQFLPFARNQQQIQEALNKTIKYLSFQDNQPELNFWQNKNLSHSNLILECNRIIINSTPENLKIFLHHNNYFSNKKIILASCFPLTQEALEELEKSYIGYDNIYVFLEGNEQPVSLLEYRLTVEIIDEITNQLKKYKLSPFEQLLYLYDKVRSRYYKKAPNEFNYYEACDLTRILLGDKIVCAGFANLFSILAKKMGIPCLNYLLDNPLDNTGHVRNLVYLKDSQYQIDGLYFFDSTLECKDPNNNYLKHYNYFAKTYNEIPTFSSNMLDGTYPYFSYDRLQRLLQTDDSSFLEELVFTGNVININNLLDLLNQPELESIFLKDIPQIKAILRKIYKLSNKPITSQTFFKALHKVRKLEYYENPSLYQYSLEELLKTVNNSGFIGKVSNTSLSSEIQKDYIFLKLLTTLKRIELSKNDFPLTKK